MKEESMKSYLDKLTTELKIMKVSERTVFIYSYFVRKFLRTQDKKPEKASDYDVKKFLANIVDSYKTKSYALILSSLRFFFINVVNNPKAVEKIKTPKVQREIKDVLTKEEVEKLIESAPTTKSKLIIGFLYSSGLRVSELTALKIKDLDIENTKGIVKEGKGKKDRILYFSKNLVSPLKRYLNPMEGDLVFPGWQGKRMNPRNIQNLLDRLRKKIGIIKKVSPHTLRRSYATHLHDDGYDIKFIQELLGHSRVDTTEKYIDVSSKQLQKIKNPLDSLNVKI